MASNTPKTMSSRLMTMKFMQRGAAKAASSPTTPNGPSSKRVRLSSGGHTPGTPSDHEVIQAALAAEEKVRQEAVDKASAAAGETKWVLSFQDPKLGIRDGGLEVVEAGFAVIDADEDSAEEEEETRPARMQFGGGVPREKPPVVDEDEESEGEQSASDSTGYDSDDPAAELIRETKREVAAKERDARKTRKREAAEDILTRTPIRSHEDMDLGGLSSLSGSGQRRGGWGGGDLSNMECFKCKQRGHKSIDCPQNPRGLPRGSSGRGRGSRGRGGR